MSTDENAQRQRAYERALKLAQDFPHEFRGPTTGQVGRMSAGAYFLPAVVACCVCAAVLVWFPWWFPLVMLATLLVQIFTVFVVSRVVQCFWDLFTR